MRFGLIGYGGVGRALHQLFQTKKDLISKYDITINYILNSRGGIYHQDNIEYGEELKWHSSLTFETLIKDDSIDAVIELSSTSLKDGQPGLFHITESLKHGKHVITGNKGPLVIAFDELIKLAADNKKQLKYGCTVGGALPTLNLHTSGFRGANMLSIEGVLNGTSNFILEDMIKESSSFDQALNKAIEDGIAEKNSTLDTEGWDTACKLLIIVNTLFKTSYKLKDIHVQGLESISKEDVKSAVDQGEVIKLVGQYDSTIEYPILQVRPLQLNKYHSLSHVNGKNKGIVFKTDTLGDIHLSGGASGTTPAAASIFRDLLEIIES